LIQYTFKQVVTSSPPFSLLLLALASHPAPYKLSVLDCEILDDGSKRSKDVSIVTKDD